MASDNERNQQENYNWRRSRLVQGKIQKDILKDKHTLETGEIDKVILDVVKECKYQVKVQEEF